MDFEDLLAPEVAIGAAIGAALFSPRVRGLLRKGAVYGLAGALMAGDAVTSAAKSAGTAAATAAKNAQRRSAGGSAAGPTERASEPAAAEMGG